jgi:hypothetical protein
MSTNVAKTVRDMAFRGGSHHHDKCTNSRPAGVASGKFGLGQFAPVEPVEMLNIDEVLVKAVSTRCNGISENAQRGCDVHAVCFARRIA